MIASEFFDCGAASNALALPLFAKNFQPTCANIPLINASSSTFLANLIPSALAFFLTSATNLAISGAIKSAGLQVMGSAPSKTRSCNSLLTGAGVAPYSPFNTPAVSLVMVLYRSPVITFITACVPTICDVGVTKGIKPKSSRTRGISRITSSNLSAAPCSFNWLSMFVNMPPGT